MMRREFAIFTNMKCFMRIRYLPLVALFFLLVSVSGCNSNGNNDANTPDTPASNAIPPPQPITFTVDAVYPHDTGAFTQGLQFYNGKLYESTGLEQKSTLRIVDIKTGVSEKKYLVPDPKIFGEGLTIFNNKIYQLTWENLKIFVYNLTDISKPIQTLHWKLQGWGITNDGSCLIISDGSDKLYYVRPDEEKNDIKMMKILSITDNHGPLDSLNELEYINGNIYANRWLTNDIVKIDTSSGHVVGRIDATGLLDQYAPTQPVTDGAVLNGIAYDSATKKLYITGKLWPKMFEIHLNN